jgi:curved DNA-binding protein CbpA
MSLYEDLNLPPDATEAQIKAAHRAHVRKHHPDNGGSTGAFSKGQHAYEVLIDPRRRQHYDETGAEAPKNPEAMDHAEMLELIGQAVMQFVVGDVDVERADIAGLASQLLRRDLAEKSQNKAKLEASLERIGKASARFKLNLADETDVVGQILEGRRGQLLLQIEKQERAVRLRTKAAEILDGYSYQTEEPLQSGLDLAELAKVLRPTAPVGG